MKSTQRNREIRERILTRLREQLQYHLCLHCKNKIYTSGKRWYHTGSFAELCDNRKAKAEPMS